MLHRNLKNGSKYNALIPKSACEKVNFGKGDTFHSVNKISEQALKHTNQVKKLAQVLKNEVATQTLQNICNKIHDFLYWHLQYKADGEAQLLRSPACAWVQRYDGVDCKSYSIFASALLLQLGIKHYIRQIKQPNQTPNEYTHVYVVVPVNQITGDLKDGYYTIDGTLQHTNEPYYLEKHDTFMNKLPHYGLNGLSAGNSLSFDNIKDIFQGVNFNTPIDCLGGTAFTKEVAQNDITTFTNRMNVYLNAINEALVLGDFNKMALEIANFIGDSTWNASIAGYKLADKDWNSCSEANIKSIHEYFSFYRYNIVKSLKVWLNQYFEVSTASYRYYGNPNFVGAKITRYFITNDIFYSDSQEGTLSVPAVVQNVFFDEKVSYDDDYLVFQVPVYTIKPKVAQIPQFEVTEVMIQSNANSNLLTPQNIIDSLNNIVTNFSSSGENLGVDDQGAGIGSDYPNTQKAGFGILGWGLVLGALGYGFVKMK